MSDFIVGAPLLLLSAIACSLSGGLFYCKAALDYEAYRIARAHLYSNDQSYCEASKALWPPQIRDKIRYQCSSTQNLEKSRFPMDKLNSVKGTLQLSSQLFVTSSVELSL